jgi:hypothetical protein
MAIAALLTLSGCMDLPAVKSVIKNQASYLQENFAPSTLPDAVRSAVTSKDSGGISFHRMTVTTSWDRTSADSDTHSKTQDTTTQINAGGPFIEVMTESTRNGVPTHRIFATSYRGILALKLQIINMNSALAQRIFEAKRIKNFDALRSDDMKQMDFVYSSGATVQIMNFSDSRNHCSPGQSYAALQVHKDLSGDAQEINCTNYNSNDVVSGKTTYVYLKKYGTALLIKSESTSGVSTGHIDSIQIE